MQTREIWQVGTWLCKRGPRISTGWENGSHLASDFVFKIKQHVFGYSDPVNVIFYYTNMWFLWWPSGCTDLNKTTGLSSTDRLAKLLVAGKEQGEYSRKHEVLFFNAIGHNQVETCAFFSMRPLPYFLSFLFCNVTCVTVSVLKQSLLVQVKGLSRHTCAPGFSGAFQGFVWITGSGLYIYLYSKPVDAYVKTPLRIFHSML